MSSGRRYAIWTLLAFLALLPFVLIGGPGAGWLRDLGLVEQGERFTELSFPDRTALPVSVTVGAPIRFDFAIRNREGRDTGYRWQAVATVAGNDVVLARGQVRLVNGEARLIPVLGSAPGSAGPAVVRVSLVARQESIDFQVTVLPPPR